MNHTLLPAQFHMGALHYRMITYESEPLIVFGIQTTGQKKQISEYKKVRLKKRLGYCLLKL